MPAVSGLSEINFEKQADSPWLTNQPAQNIGGKLCEFGLNLVIDVRQALVGPVFKNAMVIRSKLSRHFGAADVQIGQQLLVLAVLLDLGERHAQDSLSRHIANAERREHRSKESITKAFGFDEISGGGG